MTGDMLDLDAYLERIGYAGPREPTLAVLAELHRLHPAAIPFENLSPLTGEAVSLALSDLEAKLVRGRRGGYCFEHNTLFWTALEALGFDVQGLGARVRWGMPEDAPLRPRSHMALLVSLPEGRFLADVGFGGLVQTAPLRLELETVQATPHEPYRLDPAPGGLIDLKVELGAEWTTLYRFDLMPHLRVDYEPHNWFTATHPASPFPSHLMAARAEPHRRLALSDARYTVREAGRPPVERTLGSLEELAQVLTQAFGLALPEGFERAGEKLGLG